MEIFNRIHIALHNAGIYVDMKIDLGGRLTNHVAEQIGRGQGHFRRRGR